MDVSVGQSQEPRATAARGAGSRDGVFSDPRGASHVEVWGEERSGPGEGTARQRP